MPATNNASIGRPCKFHGETRVLRSTGEHNTFELIDLSASARTVTAIVLVEWIGAGWFPTAELWRNIWLLDRPETIYLDYNPILRTLRHSLLASAFIYPEERGRSDANQDAVLLRLGTAEAVAAVRYINEMLHQPCL